VKYRVRIDEHFDKESDAKELLDFARNLMSKAVSVNEGKPDQEIPFCDFHLCGHDEDKPCINWEREELIDKKVVTTRSIL